MILDIAVRQAVAGAQIIGSMAAGFRPEAVQLKEADSNSPVTAIDHASAIEMLKVAETALGDQVCLIDEEFGHSGDAQAEWQCYQDSCDGTSNLLFDRERILPVAGVTYVRKGVTEVCAVADPKTARVIYCLRNEGVWIRDFNERAKPRRLEAPLTPAQPKRVVMFDALLNEQTCTPAGQMLAACGIHAQNMRTYASCLLHLWALAEGKAHVVVIHAVGGFWDLGLHLACQMLGCRVTNLAGEDITGPSYREWGDHPFVLATAPGLDHEDLLSAAQEAFGIGYKGFRAPARVRS